ncbi:MAG TPA: hypothetical protein VFJ78_09635 [Gaiellaceae bacterium]|nr:hypothetical protein [Gaiellaceae bacterium]
MRAITEQLDAPAEQFRCDLYCIGCGYGIAARPRLPERCPICGDGQWAARTPSAGVRKRTDWLPEAAGSFIGST